MTSWTTKVEISQTSEPESLTSSIVQYPEEPHDLYLRRLVRYFLPKCKDSIARQELLTLLHRMDETSLR